MRKTGALASALRSSGATVAATHATASNDAPPGPEPIHVAKQPSRRQTKAITVHFPEEVRRQLKALAGEQGRHVDDMVAEALNLLFARYRKAEIAPRKAQ
jgi:hypothetical protein